VEFPDTRARFAALARSRGVSESALLTRMIEALISQSDTRHYARQALGMECMMGGRVRR